LEHNIPVNNRDLLELPGELSGINLIIPDIISHRNPTLVRQVPFGGDAIDDDLLDNNIVTVHSGLTNDGEDGIDEVFHPDDDCYCKLPANSTLSRHQNKERRRKCFLRWLRNKTKN
jgi:hypothetical protein